MDFISIAVRDLLRLVLAENFSTRIPCIFFTKFTYFYETSSDTVTGYHFTKKK